MKTKLTFSILIAVIFIAAMVVYEKTMDLSEIILAFTSSAGVLGFIWKWINEKELKEENAILKVMHKAELRKNNLNLGNMATDAQLEILKGQAEWIRDYGDTHPEQAGQVLFQQINNLEILLKGETLNPSLQVPPPPPN